MCVAALTAGCGAAPAAPSLLHGSPRSYLLTIDELVSPDFTVDTAPRDLAAADIAESAAAARQLTAAGLLGGAGEEFFRSGVNLADVNGPVQVRDTVEQFASAAGAATVYAADVTRIDSIAGATPISTGALGDAAHATTLTAASGGGATAVEITVEWRLANLVDVLVVRGRAGGTRLDDALILAHRQTAAELGVASSPAVTAPTTPAAPG